MGALQRKIGLMVVECVRIKMDDIRIAADMFGVAGLAGDRVYLLNAAVIAAFRLNIRRYLFVAVKTQMFLCMFAEWFVAFLALCFVFGVSAYYFARHNQGFQTGCACRQ